MLEIMPESRGKVLWVRARGKLTDQDYREVFMPRLEAVIKEHGPMRLLFHLAADFEGWDLGALWDDAKFGLTHLHDFEKIAVVGAPLWADVVVKLFAYLMSGTVRTFLLDHLAEAWEWVRPEVNLKTNYPGQD